GERLPGELTPTTPERRATAERGPALGVEDGAAIDAARAGGRFLGELVVADGAPERRAGACGKREGARLDHVRPLLDGSVRTAGAAPGAPLPDAGRGT